jgi:hypothetical protein
LTLLDCFASLAMTIPAGVECIAEPQRRHCEERKRRSNPDKQRGLLDCFAFGSQ